MNKSNKSFLLNNSYVQNISNLNLYSTLSSVKNEGRDLINLFLKDLKFIKICPQINLNYDCFSFDNLVERTKFRSRLKGNYGIGIYMLKYKNSDNLFYIGKSVNLSIRLNNHYLRSAKYNSRLGIFLQLVGWSNISVHILEFCDEKNLTNRENFYLNKYLPSLNGKFSSSYSSSVYRSLSGILAHRQSLYRKEDLRLNNHFKYSDFLWVYSYPELINLKCTVDGYLSKNYNNTDPCFKNIAEFKKSFRLYNLNNRIIYRYLDTYTPYKGLIFISANIGNVENFKDLISRNYFRTPVYLSKKIWVYNSNDLSLLNNSPFESIKSTSRLLKIAPSSIKSILNTEIGISKGYYFFDHEISDKLKSDLLSKPNVRDPISNLRIEVWVYDSNLELIDKFNSQQEMLRVLDLKRVRTVNKYKDTGINFRGFYFYSFEIDNSLKKSILDNKNYAKYTKAKLVWVMVNNLLIKDEPFLSIISAAKYLNFNRKMIAKYIDTNKIYLGYKFYSKKPNPFFNNKP